MAVLQSRLIAEIFWCKKMDGVFTIKKRSRKDILDNLSSNDTKGAF